MDILYNTCLTFTALTVLAAIIINMGLVKPDDGFPAGIIATIVLLTPPLWTIYVIALIWTVK